MPPRKRAPAKKTTAPAPTAPPAAGAPPPVATAEAPKRSAGKAPSVAVGDVVRLAPDEATPDAPAQYVQVISKVPGTEHRDAGALVVPLPEPRWMPTTAFATD